jgi:hypothetical protein
MSLRWELGECANWKELKSDKMWPMTESIIWRTVVVDYGQLKTDADCMEFYKRHVQISLAYKEDDTWLTLDTVRRYRGLHTNVSTTTRAKWRKRLIKVLERYSECALRLAKESKAITV